MEKEVKLLEVVDGETLMDMQFPKSRFCIQSLLPQGVSILGGAPKIGKSWMVLDWCVRIAKGEEVWNLPTEKGTVLYLCLEDNSIKFTSHRSNGQRLVEVSYLSDSDSSAVSDEEIVSVKTSVLFVTCDPVGEIWADKRKIG